jgi:GT2 family glycosyltransferase
MPSVSIIVATCNRPDDLRACLEGLLVQTVQPLEVIVVDDGNLEAVPLAQAFADKGIRCGYFKKQSPGLTRSRNVGIRNARGEILVFLDDDTVVGPDIIERLLEHYQDASVVGVGAVAKNEYCNTLLCRLRHIVNVIGLISGSKEGFMLPSGFYTNFGETGRTTPRVFEVQFLPGYAMSFRRHVFEHDMFDEEFFARYSYGEDKDFSLRVSRDGKLLADRGLDLYHNRSPVSRPNLEQLGYMFIVSRLMLFKRYANKSPLNYVLLIYSMTYYLLLRTLIALVNWRGLAEASRVRGILFGFATIFQKDVRVDYR